MNKNYSLLLACLVAGGFVYVQAEGSGKKDKNQKTHQAKPKATSLASKTSGTKKKSEKSVAPAKHYIYPRTTRPKNQKSGVILSGLSTKGNSLIPYSSNSKKDLHDGMMHVYENTFHAKRGHVLQIMQAIVGVNSNKDIIKFKKAASRIHEASDDWNALKDAVAAYDTFACKQVELFEKQRLQKREPGLNNRLQKAVRKIEHTQSELKYAAHSLAHSRKLLEAYAQDPRLDQYIINLEKALKSAKIQKKFNTKDERLVQTRNRLVALCVLLEGAVVHYSAVQEALVTDMEKQSVPAGKAVELIIKEIKQTLLA